MEGEPHKLMLLRNSNGVLSTELLGVVDDYITFSYAYKMETNQGCFFVRKYDVFSEDACKPSEEWLKKNDISTWGPETREFQKAWQQLVKDELLACRKDLLQGTFKYFKELCMNGEPKEVLKDLLVEDSDSDSAVNNFAGEFKKQKFAEKTWKSVKL